ncbi:Y-family DNA polymerase [Sunxiuqinia sp. A32]|uniref:Y-family DNA polymerase n=1 Tax=Sunxiuqinia sp. A32 TaxID=3461496 RepID=UPI0040454DBD
MPKRYLYIWFRYLSINRIQKINPELREESFLLYASERGRMVVQAVTPDLEEEGILSGMVVADVRAILPAIEALPYDSDADEKLLNKLAEWCFRFSPTIAIDLPDGLILDISGCPHLWGGEQVYLETLTGCMQRGGYKVNAAIADTVGTAWAMAHYQKQFIVKQGCQQEALLSLPPAALRLEDTTLQLMEKLGFRQIDQLLKIPPSNLRRRFGNHFLLRLRQALGKEQESLTPIQPTPVYVEQLPCIEPIRTANGIKIALERLLEMICNRLSYERKGMRSGIFKGHRLDGKIVQIGIGTNHASRNAEHLFKLFELKIPGLEPGLGIELFTIEAILVEEVVEAQEALWSLSSNNQKAVSELLDNIAGKVGSQAIHRYLPQEYYWPEHSIKAVKSLTEAPETEWARDSIRPLHLLATPEPIEVMVVLPDYPPMHFRYRGEVIRITKADGPERIEQEWWLKSGPPRDYYRVEDDTGVRYWLFRLGLYGDDKTQWFLHGFFV